MTFCTHYLIGADARFQWFNKELKTIEQFNLTKGEFTSYYFSNKNSITTNPIKVFKIDLRDFPEDTSIHAHGFSINTNLTYFTFPGTGYVFLFDRLQKTLTRIDDTFYRGFNFESVQFSKNGIIYSLGGSGFWNIHSTLIYFDFKRKEWEYLDTKGEIKPDRILFHTSGIDLEREKIYTLEPKEEFVLQNKGKQRVFELDLKSFVWTYKGDIDLNKMAKYDLPSTDFTWLGGLMYFHNKSENALLGDPASNELFVYKGKKKLFFGPSQHNFYIGNKIYSQMPQFTKGKSIDMLDSLTMDELRKDLVKIGALYETPWLPWSIKDIMLGVFAVFSVGSVLFIIQNGRKNRSNRKSVHKGISSAEKSVWELLSPSGLAILDFVVEHGCDYMFSTEEISKLLGCDKKAFDTQRQYRSKFISNFNAFFEEHFMITDAIYRISSDEDKRFVCYQLSEKVVNEYKSYLNSLD